TTEIQAFSFIPNCGTAVGDEPYVVDHTADTYIIDSQGKLVRRMAHGSSIEELLGAIQPLLQENLSR
ncbi:MAG: hypothetical protein KME58_18430, partial [Candidatus Thiodiazotropha sp. (ex Lucina pensylvanica)]|nr:hypothetical protein [Candidatus Thiodiazotropha sp. (ex Lucina pensylvanica)]